MLPTILEQLHEGVRSPNYVISQKTSGLPEPCKIELLQGNDARLAQSFRQSGLWPPRLAHIAEVLNNSDEPLIIAKR